MTVNERISKLRHLMCEHNIDAYLIPSSDYHQSEYIGAHFKTREFITGFTGSAGTAVITAKSAGLWTDGRYFIQAEKELSQSDVALYRIGEPDVPTIEAFLETHLPPNGTLGFDGRVISMEKGITYKEKFTDINIRIDDRYDLIDSIWEDRPPMSEQPIFLLSENYTGESTTSKLARVRSEMQAAGATVHLLATLDDIAWLFNFRGRDVLYTPVALCYAVIMLNCVHLFMNEEKISCEIQKVFEADGVILHPYQEVYTFIEKLDSKEVILLDPSRVNYALFRSIPEQIKQIREINPCVLLKVRKNEIEIENIRKAHVKDAVAVTKFIYWLKTTYDKETITELSAAAKLETLRGEQEHYLWPSFEPICAYGANAAMCHYSASEETDCTLTEGSFFLTDTGGNYMDGSTDITRTIALGKVSADLKRNFTNVLRGNLALSNAHFLYGSSGHNLDILARQYLWQEHQDFNHGTGHGVGYLLSIHEPGCRFAWRSSEETLRPLEEGMVITDEPGLYVANSHGIRLENELLVRTGCKNEYGQFMHFEVLTYVPFDLDAIDTALLSESEKQQLNRYHKKVYDTVAPHLDDKERAWLASYTAEI